MPAINYIAYEDVATGKKTSIGSGNVNLATIGSKPTVRVDVSADVKAVRHWLTRNGVALPGYPWLDVNPPFRAVSGDKPLALADGTYIYSATPCTADGKTLGPPVSVTLLIGTAPKPSKPTPPPVVIVSPVPDQPAQTDETPARKAIRGTIVEGADAYDAARAAGFTLAREWCSVNWSTGRINDPKDVKRCNALVAKGWRVILTVTPDEASSRRGERCADFSIVAVQLIAAGLHPSVIVQLVNEGQHKKKDEKTGKEYGPYWPNGDIIEATEVFAVPIAVILKAAGYTLAAPSITWGTPADITAWIDGIFANSPPGLWTYIDGHLYLSDVDAYERIGKTYADAAAKHGVTAISSEWSFKVGNDEFVKYVPRLFAIMDKYFAIHCLFSFTFGAKFNPKNSYLWRDGKPTVAYDAIKRLAVTA